MAESRDPGRPWEVWVVIAFLAINVAVSLFSGRVMGVAIGILVIMGLFKQSNGTWWFVTAVNTLATIVFLCFAVKGDRSSWMPAMISGGVVGLLISCRARGAY